MERKRRAWRGSGRGRGKGREDGGKGGESKLLPALVVAANSEPLLHTCAIIYIVQ